MRILQHPHPALATRSTAVEIASGVPQAIAELAAGMEKAMKAANGIGLAANQVGVTKRVIVISMGTNADALVMINPEITRAEGEQWSAEGCLSVGFGVTRGVVKRAKRVRVQYIGIDGVSHNKKFQGLYAACVQHEIDHLDGFVFTQRVHREAGERQARLMNPS